MSHWVDDLEATAAVLERASNATVDRSSLQQRLESLAEAVGRAEGGDEYATAFQEFTAAEPGHSELAASSGNSRRRKIHSTRRSTVARWLPN